jgi:hypothetical protein
LYTTPECEKPCKMDPTIRFHYRNSSRLTPESTTNYISQIRSITTLTALNPPHPTIPNRQQTHTSCFRSLHSLAKERCRLHAHRGLWYPGEIRLWAERTFTHLRLYGILGFQFSSGHSSLSHGSISYPKIFFL